MAQKPERLKGLKDKLQKNRNILIYMIILLTVLGTAMGWKMLPETVSINPASENMIYRAKEQMLMIHASMVAFFTFMFWKRPREITYLFGAVVCVGLVFLLLYANLGG